MVVHGIPGSYRLERGDIISIDVGVTLDGWVADAARTFPVGEIDPAAAEPAARHRASRCTRASRSAVPGNRMGDVSSAIQRVAEGAGLSVVRSLVGHGVGRSMHEDPQVPNYGKPGKGPLLRGGHGARDRADDDRRARRRCGSAGDGWAIFSQDGSPAAHFEFTIAITAEGPRILTPWHLAPAERRTVAEPQAASSAG